ncbi:MAG: elongation factor G [Myxococcota bacterium]
MAKTKRDLNYLRNIGISAHIDSGKTTLTERILFYTGQINMIHDFRGKDGVGAKMDSMELERERGITIQSAATYCDWGEYAINIIDTPGHVDFTIEVERALRVLDGAILVLCSVSGVQSQSITVDRQMKRYKVPAIAFVNKCDRSGADPLGVCQQLREDLGHNSFMIQHPIGLEDRHQGVVDLITMQAYYFDGDSGEEVVVAEIPDELVEVCQAQREKMLEGLADFSDDLAMLFLEGEEVPSELILDVMRKATISRKFTPVCLGSAYKNKGVQPLLDKVTELLPSPLEMPYEALDQDNEEAIVELKTENDLPLVMLAFKLEDGRYGQLTYCRVYQGQLNKGDTIYNSNDGKKHKAGRLVQMHSDEMHDIDYVQAGGIVALFGIDCASGDTFTDGKINYTMTSMFVPDAVIEIAVEPRQKTGLANFSKAINRFSKEDPTFRVRRDEESGQTILGGMGELHLEVYIERIKREYGVEVDVGQPEVAYRETITAHVDFSYTHKKQTGGSGQFAKIGGFLEPAEEGEHYQFINEIVGGAIPKEYQPSCDKGFRSAMDEGGLIGFPVVGIAACINDGQSHPVDSSDMAFQIAARGAFRENYMKAKPVILEPIMKVVVETPDEFQGTVLGGINKRRGQVLNNVVKMNQSTIEAEVPLAEMFGYSNELRSSTQGKAEFSMEFKKYSPVPRSIQEELIEKYSGGR